MHTLGLCVVRACMAWPFASRPAAHTYIDNIHRSTTDQHAALLTRRDPAFEPDWAGFVAVDRGSAQSKAAHDGGAVVVPPQDGASVWKVDEFVARKDTGVGRVAHWTRSWRFLTRHPCAHPQRARGRRPGFWRQQQRTSSRSLRAPGCCGGTSVRAWLRLGRVCVRGLGRSVMRSIFLVLLILF